MSFETIQSKTIFKGRVFAIHQDQVRYPDGRMVTLDVVDHNGAVTIIPVDEDGQVWFVRQYRHPAKEILLEFPAGVLNDGEVPEEAARREIREEIGMAARDMQLLGEFFLAPGYSTEYMAVFLATGLSPDPLAADEDEMIEIEKVSLEQAIQMAENGEIKDAKSVAGLFLALKVMKAK